MPLEGVVAYPPELAARYRARGYWEDRPLIAHFVDAFRRHADRVAIVHRDERITYRELGERSRRLALNLLDLGFRPLDVVVMHLPNVPEFVYTYFALQHVGAIPLMALPLHRYHEISHFVAHTEAKGYAIPDRVGDFDYATLARQVRERSPSLRQVLVAGDDVPPGAVSIRELLAKPPRLGRESLAKLGLHPTDPCCFQLSGGTTGIPKVIPRTHNDYVYNSKASGAVIDIRPDDALLVVLPVAHNFPLASPGIQAFLLAGARIVLSPSNRLADCAPLLERERITHLELVPALLIRWLDDPLLARTAVSSVRVVNCGGQKWQPETKVRAERAFPSAKAQEVFGMAEGMLFYSRLDDPPAARYETVGRPVCPDDEVRLIDDEGNEVAEGDVGELACRGPYTLRGYYRVPEHDARAFTPEGFYKTGDLMRRDRDGNYVVEGRKKDVINRGGEKISAEEVENLVLMHPAVRLVACVPMPDRVLGERICAFVVPRDGRTIELPELQRHLTERGLARYKHPERVELVDEIPVSPVGKVRKGELAARIKETLDREEASRI